jgi:hypothetical protein
MVISFLIEGALTLIVCYLSAAYMRRYLHLILKDLCGSEDRAAFWTVLSIFLLVGIPAIRALNYHPVMVASQDLFFEIIGRFSDNLVSFLPTLIGIALIVSLFALVAPKPTKVETK